MIEIYKFYKSSSVIEKMQILKSLIQLPGMLLHELSHSVFATLLFFKFCPIKCNYFYKIKGEKLYSYYFYVETNGLRESKINRIKLSIVNIAPMLTIIAFSYLQPMFLVYLAISFKTLIPSKGDFENLKLNISHIF